MTFNSDAGAFVIGDGTGTPNAGNAFVLTGGVTNNSTNLEIINNPFSMPSGQTFTTTADGGNIALGGVISGGGGLTTSGAGTLFLTNSSNNFTNGVSLNNGSLNFVSGALNGNTINCDGGTLQWATGNSQDVSSKISIPAGQSANLDTNGNNVTFATGITAGSGGSLAKFGNGTLTLNAANSYNGGTTINAGTLVMGNKSALGSSSNIGSVTVAPGATLDLNGYAGGRDFTASLTIGGSGATTTARS